MARAAKAEACRGCAMERGLALPRPSGDAAARGLVSPLLRSLRSAMRTRYNQAWIEVNAMPTATVAKKRPTVKGATRTAASQRTRRSLDDPKKRREVVKFGHAHRGSAPRWRAAGPRPSLSGSMSSSRPPTSKACYTMRQPSRSERGNGHRLDILGFRRCQRSRDGGQAWIVERFCGCCMRTAGELRASGGLIIR